MKPTPEAIRIFNQSHATKIGLFHVTFRPVEASSRIKALRKLYRKNTSEARSLRLMRDWLSPDQREQFDGSTELNSTIKVEYCTCDNGCSWPVATHLAELAQISFRRLSRRAASSPIRQRLDTAGIFSS